MIKCLKLIAESFEVEVISQAQIITLQAIRPKLSLFSFTQVVIGTGHYEGDAVSGVGVLYGRCATSAGHG